MKFEVLAVDGAARAGRLATARGVVETPIFMPVGTHATVKALAPDDLRAAGASIVLANTYHLFLRPGHEVVRELGGLHRFMGWDGVILTDSGGFQVFSLSKLRKITDAGVEFRSPVDGSTHFLSPEIAVEVQHALGADIIHPLDECLAYPASGEAARRSLELTLRWAARSKAAHVARGAAGRAMFGIVQGGSDEALRRQAARATVELGFDGYAIGGMAVGEPKPAMYDLTALVASLLPVEQPRYLMGVGKPEDLVESVARGVDMFAGSVRARRRTARRGMRLLRLPRLLARLPSPPLHVRRAARVSTAHAAQRHVLPPAPTRDAFGDRQGRLRAIPGSVLLALCSISDAGRAGVAYPRITGSSRPLLLGGTTLHPGREARRPSRPSRSGGP